nr:ribonuclease H-like domain-containing protein [Tanacetum cinerariifolium]
MRVTPVGSRLGRGKRAKKAPGVQGHASFYHPLCKVTKSYEVTKFLHDESTATGMSTVAPLTPKESQSGQNHTLLDLYDPLGPITKEIDSLVTILTSLGSLVNEEYVVHYAVEGLPEKYNQVCGYMHYQDTFPNLKTTRSLLIAAEMRLKSKELTLPVDSSSFMVLMAQSGLVTTGQATLLPHAFIARTLHDLLPVHRTWIQDLYPVTDPSPIPSAFLVVQQTWHQRLGHPKSDVLRCLVSNNVISCNKEKPPVLCHACQLGKHVRLSFVSYSTVVFSCFDIVHLDVWTSPIPSISGFKYCVLFLDHYSQFVWVYPFIHKFDVLSKFVLFCNYVRTQFKCEIRFFQCDHGGEFDNHNLHNLFNTNGIQFRLSCPKTSQQNGKSERIVRTINNLIQTLLFQASLPPTFWVKALNMAATFLTFYLPQQLAMEFPLPAYMALNPTIAFYALLAVYATLTYILDISLNRGYRCLDLTTNKIILSRHVTFNETVFSYGSTKPASVPSYTFLDDPDIPTSSIFVSKPPSTVTVFPSQFTPNNNEA